METKLRVKEIQGPQENYQHTRPEPSIEPNPEHDGLRVKTVAPKGTPLVESHPNHPNRIAGRKHPEHESLSRLGDNRERK